MTTTEPDLFDFNPVTGFDGGTFEPEHDQTRLGSQLQRVFDFMKEPDWMGNSWHTLDEIEFRTGVLPQSSSARLRDFRKAKFGGHTVLRRRRGEPAAGVFEYRLVLNGSEL